MLDPFMGCSSRFATLAVFTDRYLTRFVLGLLIAGAVTVPGLLHGYGLTCAVRLVVAAAAVGALLLVVLPTADHAEPRRMLEPGRDRPGLRKVSHAVAAFEAGFLEFEVLILAAGVALVVVGLANAYGAQARTIAQGASADGLQDVAAAVAVDANAAAAYSSSTRSLVLAASQQSWSVPFGTSAATIQAKPTGTGVSVIATFGTTQASIVAPVVPSKPVPQ